jgi:hypothetical protein
MKSQAGCLREAAHKREAPEAMWFGIWRRVIQSELYPQRIQWLVPDVLLQSINRSGQTYSYSPSDSCERIEIYTRFSPEFCRPVLDGTYFTIRNITIPDNLDILLAVVYFPSKLYWNEARRTTRFLRNQALQSVL